MAGIIITCARHFEPDACSEIEETLERMGDESARAHPTSMSGIITVETAIDPQSVVEQMRKLVDEEPWSVRYIMRVIPVMQWVASEESDIISTALQMSEKLLAEDLTYRITIEKRNSGISSKNLITEIAEKIPNKVSLEKSQAVVLVQILGAKTGISVMREPAVLSVGRQKRIESE